MLYVTSFLLFHRLSGEKQVKQYLRRISQTKLKFSTIASRVNGELRGGSEYTDCTFANRVNGELRGDVSTLTVLLPVALMEN